MTNTFEANFFWYGGRLSWVEELCLRSFIRFPKVTVNLYTYDPDLRPPLPHCVCHDAGQFLPREIADRWKAAIGRSAFTPVSCLFRYRLLFEMGGWYFDTDCLLLRPLTPLINLDYVFARDGAYVNNAVIKFPKHTEMLDRLYQECVRVDPETYQPGSFTEPFTRYLKKSGLLSKALPRGYFYPMGWNMASDQRHHAPEEGPYIVHLYGTGNRDLFYPKTAQTDSSDLITSLQRQMRLLDNSLSLRIARRVPFGKVIRRLLLMAINERGS